jgi:hypothetical protein
MLVAAISACITGFLQNGEQHIGLLNILVYWKFIV